SEGLEVVSERLWPGCGSQPAECLLMQGGTMPKGERITRRTMLKGLGACLALPWLEAMTPAQSGGAAVGGSRPVRVVFVYHPLGAETTAWKGVTGAGADMRLTPTLRPLESVKQKLLILDGLNGRPHPPSGHNRSACLWLSSAGPSRRDSWGVETDITLDQILAPQLSRGTRQPSLELSCTTVGNLMHAMNLSWRGPGSPLGAENRPRDVFARMFGDRRQEQRHASILDVVGEDARRLRTRLGQDDRGRLDEYLESVRSLERRIAASDSAVPGSASGPAGRGNVPPIDVPEQIPERLQDYTRLMLDLLVIALQTDFTRVATCALGDESETLEGTTYNRRLADFGIDRASLAGQVEARYLDWGHHACTHEPRPTLPIIQAIDRWYVEQLAYFLGRLDAVREGGASLLDNSIVVYGSTNGGGGSGVGWPGHNLGDVACLLAGGGAGLLRQPGRVIRYYGPRNQGVPLSNLWLTLAQLLGLERREFGLSTGTLSDLA
ncbi:MAG: DUF1552 domain-containing protein, partial [Gemmataceae bacterium]|nr:DUF1552 domain-containing protein [Gemmataceae bacterium]